MRQYAWHLPDPETQPAFYEGVTSKRFLAWLIDTFIIAILCVMVLPFTAFTGIFFFPFLMLVVGFAYRVVTLTNGSATLGMRLLAIEFRDAEGDRLSLGLAFWHTLGLSVSFAMPLLQVISVVLMLTTARGQGLSDMVLGTVAINKPARG